MYLPDDNTKKPSNIAPLNIANTKVWIAYKIEKYPNSLNSKALAIYTLAMKEGAIVKNNSKEIEKKFLIEILIVLLLP